MDAFRFSPVTIPVPPLDDRSFRRLLKRATMVLCAALALPAMGLLVLVLILLRAGSWVDQTDKVIARTNHMQRLLFSMQTSFRGYRFSGDADHLKRYTRDLARAREDWPVLVDSVSTNPKQAAQVKSAHARAEDWIRFVEQELAALNDRPELIVDPEFLRRGVPLFDAAVSELDRVSGEEERLLESRARMLDQIVSTLLISLAVGGLIGIPLLARWLQRLLRRVSAAYSARLEELARRAGELSVTLKSIGDAIIATDTEARVEFLNPVAEQLLGWTTDEIKGRPLPEIFHIVDEKSREIIENPVERVLREDRVMALANHTVLQTRDGREVPIEDSAAPIRGEDGRVIGVILVFRDVTEKRRAEEKLRGSEILKSAILKTALDGFILMDHEGHVRDVNPACEQIFGYSQDYMQGRLLGDLIVPERLREAHQSGLKRYVESREARILGRRMELPGLRADGTEFPCELSITHIADTEPPLFAGYVRDITDRKSAEAALEAATARAEASSRAKAEAAERFRLLSEVVALQVWTAQPDGQLDFVNAEVGEYFGVDIGPEILGEAWAQFVHPEDLPATVAIWQSCLATGQRYETEFRLRRADGEYRWFLTRAEAMRDDEGQVVIWFGINTDIHELKVAQAEADRASRAKDDFLAVLSHELRTPLTPVLMAAAALGEDERLPPEVRAQLGMMERNIGLEARLIDDLLDITRIAKGKLPLRPQRCDAHSLIGLAIEIVRDDAQTKRVKLEQEFLAERCGLVADPSRFQQVIWNLLRNAVKFTPSEGTVTIRTRDKTDENGSPWLSIEVRDSGIGIEAEAIERIFRPFEQAELTGDHRFGGIGLGLAIARAIVDLHGGTIRAESEGVDRGSVFVVELPGATLPPPGLIEPTRDSSSALPDPGGDEQGSTAPAPLRLLLVEDHGPTLQVLERLLTRAGHQVVVATSVETALNAAAADQFDGVISDLGLPDGTGNGLMEKLRERHQLSGIALTGYGMEDDVERSRGAGFLMHLIKPIDFGQLRRALSIFRKRGD